MRLGSQTSRRKVWPMTKVCAFVLLLLWVARAVIISGLWTSCLLRLQWSAMTPKLCIELYLLWSSISPQSGTPNLHIFPWSPPIFIADRHLPRYPRDFRRLLENRNYFSALLHVRKDVWYESCTVYISTQITNCASIMAPKRFRGCNGIPQDFLSIQDKDLS